MAKEANEVSIPVVLLKEREPNEVDELLQRITEIQEKCSHDYRLFAPHGLRETLVKGIYQASHGQAFSYKCLKCSKEDRRRVTIKCLNCSNEPLTISVSEEYEDLQRYFSQEHIKAAHIKRLKARIYRCDKCGFTLVIPSLADYLIEF